MTTPEPGRPMTAAVPEPTLEGKIAEVPTVSASAQCELSEAEREVLQGVFAGWSTMPGDLVPAVESILTARLAAVPAAEAELRAAVAGLAEECDRLNVWMAHDVPNHDPKVERRYTSVNRRASDVVRSLLAGRGDV